MLSHSTFEGKLKISEAGNETKYWSLGMSKSLALTAHVGAPLSLGDVWRQNINSIKNKSLYYFPLIDIR